MLKYSFLVIGLLLVITNGASARQDESKEPALNYEIRIDDKSVTVAENETTEIKGNFENPKVRIVPGEFREFPYMGVKFFYPREFVFESDLSDSTSKSWTLTGNDLNVMLFEISAELSTVEFGNSMIGEFGSQNARISDPNISAKFGNLELPGSRLDVKIGSSAIRMEIMKLPSPVGKTKLLVFQDSLTEQGEHSDEGKRTMAKIRSTFKFTK